MGSAFGPLTANTFMCNVEEQLTNQNKMTAFYNRYVDDTLRKMRDISSASEVLSKLNEIHPSLSFTMELEDNSELTQQDGRGKKTANLMWQTWQ